MTRIVLFVLACIGTSSLAFAWGSATHAYIAGHLNRKGPVLTLNQVYGSMGADAFNYMFEHPDEMAWLSTATHCAPLPVWKVALFPTAKAEAYGFVSHNNLWAADSTAHFPACPPDLNPTEGYIFLKGQDVASAVASDPTFGPQLLALGLPPELQDEIFRDLTEFGVDILVKRSDPLIGQKITTATLLRSPEFPLLLVAAYARGFSTSFGIPYLQALQIIKAEELKFRQTTLLYGQALTQSESMAIQLIAEQTAQLAQGLLAAYGITLPPGTDLVPLIEFSINQAVSECQSDYAGAINDTIDKVKTELPAHGIVY